MREGLTRTE